MVQEITIKSERFGEIRIDSTRVIEIIGGLIGFPDETSFVILDYNTPFSFLHSIKNPHLAFVVMSASEFGEDYAGCLPVEDPELDILSPETVSFLNIVTVRSNPSDSTVNLRAPVMINPVTRRGRQIILEDQDLSIRSPLFS